MEKVQKGGSRDFSGTFGQQAYTFGTEPEQDKRKGFTPTGVEDVRVGNTEAPKPQSWNEAVRGQFEKPKPRFGNNQDLIDYLQKEIDNYRPLTKEQEEKIRKKQKAEKIMSSVADAAMAVSNLWGTTQYAPDSYNGMESMTAKAQARFDKEKAERAANDERFLNYSLMLGKLKDEHEATQYQRGRDAIADQIRQSQEDRAQAKADHDAAMADLKEQLLLGKIDDQAYRSKVKSIEADYADAYWNARVDVLKSQKSKNDRWQPSQGRSGGGKPAEYAWRDKDGNLHYVHSEAAARNRAEAEGGTYVTTPKVSTREYTDRRGQKQVSTTTTDVSTPMITIDWVK